MAGKSISHSDACLNMFLGTFPTTTQVPATTFVALLTTNPTIDDGTNAVETTYTGYARPSVVSTSSGWNGPTNGIGNTRQLSNAAVLNFGSAASGPVTLTGFAVCKTNGSSAITVSGEIIYWNILTGGNQVINNGSPVTAAIGSLIINED